MGFRPCPVGRAYVAYTSLCFECKRLWPHVASPKTRACTLWHFYTCSVKLRFWASERSLSWETITFAEILGVVHDDVSRNHGIHYEQDYAKVSSFLKCIANFPSTGCLCFPTDAPLEGEGGSDILLVFFASDLKPTVQVGLVHTFSSFQFSTLSSTFNV